ncbi:Histone deacetylase HDT1 Histone deacetylase [Vigna angularis]|uniref:Histone deacetylase HDT1 Histone deacetylase n=1 Tax=Phaseolus angularis TaxID=3914 RepID=A0A8T0L1W2_PHAAN|nr:Histone deacetylase HDT1 Histone deacetylase [Vigna angularis]
MKRGSGHQANNGGAIRVRNERASSRSSFDVLHHFGVHFGNNQRHLLVHPKDGAIVHHHCPPIHRGGAEFLVDGPAGAEERDVNTVETIRRELLHDVVPILKGDPVVGGALRGQHFDGAVGEVAVREHGEELLADDASDADDGNAGQTICNGKSVEVKSGESLKVDPGDDKIIHLSNACLGDVTKAKGESVALYVKFGNQKLVLGTLSSDKFPQISYDLIFEKEFELSHSWKNGRKPDFEVKHGVKPDEAKQKKTADPKKNEKAKEKDADGEDEDSSESDSDDDSSEDKIEAGKKRNIDSAKKTTIPVKKAKFVTPQKTG